MVLNSRKTETRNRRQEERTQAIRERENRLEDLFQELRSYKIGYDKDKVMNFLFEYVHQTFKWEDVSHETVPGLLEFVMSKKLEEFIEVSEKLSKAYYAIPNRDKTKGPKLTLPDSSPEEIRRIVFHDHSGEKTPMFYSWYLEQNPRLTPDYARDFADVDIHGFEQYLKEKKDGDHDLFKSILKNITGKNYLKYTPDIIRKSENNFNNPKDKPHGKSNPLDEDFDWGFGGLV